MDPSSQILSRPSLPREPDARTTFQAWHAFDSSLEQWTKVDASTTGNVSTAQHTTDHSSKLVLVTWNVDAFERHARDRILGIISHVKSLEPAVDILFLQEVSENALGWLLHDTWMRDNWVVSDIDSSKWGGEAFGTLTLLSTSRFDYGLQVSRRATPSKVWRVDYPSYYGRDALCCDIFLPASGDAGVPSSQPPEPTPAMNRLRLINVHLDSLKIDPSMRPRQLAITASLLRNAGGGLIAGDFNPVSPEDKTLVQENNLMDAWTELHPKEPGFTWGVDGKASFPPGRLDKIAMLGLKPLDMEVMHPGRVARASGVGVPWSDHSGLKCSFRLAED